MGICVLKVEYIKFILICLEVTNINYLLLLVQLFSHAAGVVHNALRERGHFSQRQTYSDGR